MELRVNQSDEGRWAPIPNSDGAQNQRAVGSEAGAGEISDPGRVVALGAICDLHQTSDDGRSVSFGVSEFAMLEDGRRVILHADRGFTTGWGSSVSTTLEVWKSETIQSMAQHVLNVVLPDDDDSGDEHPWDWLADLARARGIRVSPDDLRKLPYQVVLSDAVTRLITTD